MADPTAIADTATKLLTLDWTQVSVLIGALILIVCFLAYVIVWWGRQRESACEERYKAAHGEIVNVLKGECQKSTTAIDACTAALEQQTKSTERLCSLVDDIRKARS